MTYQEFIERKSQIGTFDGFEPVWMPDFLFDFQKDLVAWAIRKGRAALFEDCGLGKTPQQLVWAENIVRKTNGNVLILAPLAVAQQTVHEGEKFGIRVHHSRDGNHMDGITVTNYERLHYFSPSDFEGVVCDESSILKNFDGTRRGEITDFMRKKKYRLLCTATAAPNDYIELGTSSEALGEMGYMDMLGRFFKNDQNVVKPMIYRHKGQVFSVEAEKGKWRMKAHAERFFWQWVASWARACRRPSDLGYDDGPFTLPPLMENQIEVENTRPLNGNMFIMEAIGLDQQRAELKATIKERCEKVAELVSHDRPALVWCHYNPEGDLMEKIIPDAEQVSGKDSDDRKEEKLIDFCEGRTRVLITKPKIAGFGLNLQHCAHETFFPSHSYEQYYQGIRRCWRFGQTRPVQVDIITTPGMKKVMNNLQRKSKAAEVMFDELVKHMNDAYIAPQSGANKKEEIPSWL